MPGSGDLVELIPMAALALDSRGRVAAINARWSALLGTDAAGAELAAWFPEESGLITRLREAVGTRRGHPAAGATRRPRPDHRLRRRRSGTRP